MTAALDDDEITLEDLFEQARTAHAEEFQVATVAVVETYTAGAQVADVTPVINRLLPRADRSVLREPFPTCRQVRLVWPRAGNWFLHMPLSAGDFVLLVACDRDLSRWIVTGELSDPIDRRTHHLAHAVAIPGLYPATLPLGDVPTDALVLGKDGGSTLRVEDGGDVRISASGANVVITADEVQAAGTAKVAMSTELDVHLSAIAADMDLLKIAIAAVGGSFTPTYGATEKAVLDGTSPIPSTKLKGA